MSQAGIYIHIPFCRSRCSYCDFATGMYTADVAERYVGDLVREIGLFNQGNTTAAVDTIYFGGGTPSLLSSAQLECLLASVYQRFEVSPQAEITLEINPGTMNAETLREFSSLGVNRGSFGAQTFDDGELARLGRSHTSHETLQTFGHLREAGFTNISFDLIAGLPGQTIKRWTHNLDQAFALRPEHLSFYLLEVHQNTPLAEHIKRGLQPAPNDDLAAEMYSLMLERANAYGYQHYEISNLCLPGFQSRHNTKYWTGAAYYGFGCSAHSYNGKDRRWSNEPDIGRYMEFIERDGLACADQTILSSEDRRAEAVFLGLRMMSGLGFKRFQQLFGTDLRQTHADDLSRFTEAGLIEVSDDLLKLTRAGALMSNEVFAALI